MNAAKLDREITIQRLEAVGPDKYGVAKNAVHIASTLDVRAQLLASKAEERTLASGHVKKAVISLRIRYNDFVRVGFWLNYRGEQFEVTEITEVGRRKWLDLTAESLKQRAEII